MCRRSVEQLGKREVTDLLVASAGGAPGGEAGMLKRLDGPAQVIDEKSP